MKPKTRLWLFVLFFLSVAFGGPVVSIYLANRVWPSPPTIEQHVLKGCACPEVRR